MDNVTITYIRKALELLDKSITYQIMARDVISKLCKEVDEIEDFSLKVNHKN
jgi:hypothetical protein